MTTRKAPHALAIDGDGSSVPPARTLLDSGAGRTGGRATRVDVKLEDRARLSSKIRQDKPKPFSQARKLEKPFR
jgi:hypothetical protein